MAKLWRENVVLLTYKEAIIGAKTKRSALFIVEDRDESDERGFGGWMNDGNCRQ